MKFRDRKAAGKLLAEALREYAGTPVVVYALPRGGVVPGVEIARALRAPLDLVITRKIEHPAFPEYAIAAVAESGDPIVNEEEAAGIDKAWMKEAVGIARAEARRRREKYAAGLPPLSPEGKTAIIVDDGIATGLTMKAALAEISRRHPKHIVIAVPVAPGDTVAKLSSLADRVVALRVPESDFGAIGEYYEDFPQLADAEVAELLASIAQPENRHNAEPSS